MKALQILLTTIIRNGLMITIAYFVRHKWIDATTLSAVDITELVALIISGLGVLWWAFYSRIKAQFEKIVALRSASSQTLADVTEKAADTPLTTKIAAVNVTA